MDNILITGANGLTGAHLIDELRGSASIVACSRDGQRPAEDGVRAMELDLSRPIDRATLPDRLSCIVHLAQSSRFRDFPGGATDMTAVNVANTVALLDHAVASGARTFVYASSGGVYAPGSVPLVESAVLAESPGFYPASKQAGEILARAYASHIVVIILRFFFIYGAGQKREMLIPRLVDNVRAGRAIMLDGSDGIRINPVHVRDAAQAVVAALRLEKSTTINVAGSEILSIRQIVSTVGQLVDREPRFEIEARTPVDLVADINRQTSLLGPPRVHFSGGVRDLL